ncbi:hypothetical protein [Streptomyces sp. NPDC005573]|uniref:hypothetical protein n=1 Tax=unclassified Streptomyces TaxID=2593676 RepID=UPI0033AA2A57
MKKFVVGALLGVSLIMTTATSASAAGWYYTGYWYPTAAACEAGYQQLVGGPTGPGVDLPHQCRYNAGGNVYELWRQR